MVVLAGAHCFERQTMTEEAAFGVMIVFCVNGSDIPASHAPNSTVVKANANVLREKGQCFDTANPFVLIGLF